ncbi:MAG: hypothetical protein BroJett029_03740 [Alphaproteobacteria bacterium]|nr:MAG: hypothetical protein BroJett029_03740 [Alphaproteobacteria bacterium]
MADKSPQRATDKGSSSTKKEPHGGGDAARQAQKWGGGTKGSKGAVTGADKRNPNSSAKS